MNRNPRWFEFQRAEKLRQWLKQCVRIPRRIVSPVLLHTDGRAVTDTTAMVSMSGRCSARGGRRTRDVRVADEGPPSQALNSKLAVVSLEQPATKYRESCQVPPSRGSPFGVRGSCVRTYICLPKSRLHRVRFSRRRWALTSPYKAFVPSTTPPCEGV